MGGPKVLLALPQVASDHLDDLVRDRVELGPGADVGRLALGPLPYRLVELVQGVGGIIIASDLQSCSSNATLSLRARHPP